MIKEKLTVLMIFRTFATYFLAVIIAVIFIVPCFICALFPENVRYDNKFYFWCVAIACKLLLKVSFLPIKISGKYHIPHGPVIFVANHQSSIDIPVVASIVGSRKHIWLVLEYYAKFPILGFFVRRMNVTVDRGSLEKSARSIVKVLRLLKDQERDLIIFPEAARFVDGAIHKFMPGLAMFSKKLNRPVVPIYMPNNYKIYPPGSFWIQDYPVVAIIGQPFVCGENESEEDFTVRVHDWFVSLSENQTGQFR